MTTVHIATQHCPTWCLRHDPGVEELCIGPAVELDFGHADPANREAAHHARILTYNEPGNIVTISLVVNGTSSSDMTPQQARLIGTALIQAADTYTAGDGTQTVPNLTLLPGGASR